MSLQSIFSEISAWFEHVLSNKTTLDDVIAKGESVTARLLLLAQAIEADVTLPTATKVAIDQALEQAQAALAALKASPIPDNVDALLKALTAVVTTFPAGDIHNEAQTTLSVVSLVWAAYQSLEA